MFVKGYYLGENTEYNVFFELTVIVKSLNPGRVGSINEFDL